MPRTLMSGAARSLVLVLVLSAMADARAAGEFAFHHENVMGTSMELRVRADDSGAAGRAEAAVLAEIDRLSAILSGYDGSSEFRRWQKTVGVPTPVSAELFEMLERADAWRSRGKGTFDPRVQALTELWSRCAKEGRVPTEAERAGALALMAEPAWRLDRDAKTATHLSNCPLSLDGIAKGYIVDRACEAAKVGAGGVRALMLNVGGDLRVVGPMDQAIGIAWPGRDSETSRPITTIEVANLGVATSGNDQRGFTIGSRRYSHIFDPRDGQPLDRVVSATVIAPNLADADAMAKIVGILTTDDSLTLVESIPGVECLLVSADGVVSRSQGFRRFERPRISTISLRNDTPTADGSKAAWNDAFELAVDFEISPPTGKAGRYRRPYVAIWVEDADGLAVRTLTLWVQSTSPGPRWIPDLKRWYKADQVRRLVDKTDLVETTSRATRPAGKYKVVWDGTDDRGQRLHQGKYTLSIEVAREHGTHQLIRKELTLGDTPIAETLEANVEIKAASVEYRRKADAR
ncbi:DUF2271 domain-containing protein [Isosphaeraceae bacterium EP7]